jgi:hypothetical protein
VPPVFANPKTLAPSRDGRHSTVIEMHFLPAALRSTSRPLHRIWAAGALVLLMSLNAAGARHQQLEGIVEGGGVKPTGD